MIINPFNRLSSNKSNSHHILPLLPIYPNIRLHHIKNNSENNLRILIKTNTSNNLPSPVSLTRRRFSDEIL